MPPDAGACASCHPRYVAPNRLHACMANASSTQSTAKTLLLTVRTDAAERAHLQQVAAERSTTVSNLIRDALRREGALPAQAA